MRKKNQIVYTQSDLIREIAKEYPIYSVDDIKNILEVYQSKIEEHLSESEIEHSVKVKLFAGLSLSGWVIPAATRNCFGVNLDIEDKIRVKPTVTKYFTRKVNEQSR